MNLKRSPSKKTTIAGKKHDNKKPGVTKNNNMTYKPDVLTSKDAYIINNHKKSTNRDTNTSSKKANMIKNEYKTLEPQKQIPTKTKKETEKPDIKTRKHLRNNLIKSKGEYFSDLDGDETVDQNALSKTFAPYNSYGEA